MKRDYLHDSEDGVSRSLFEHGEAYARTTDPVTSHQAAATVDANRLEQSALEGLEKLEGRGTIKQVSAAVGIHEWSIGPRFAPLRRKGLIRDSGERDGRCIVWELVHKERP